MLGLQAIPSPLYRATVARIAEAAAGAGCGRTISSAASVVPGMTNSNGRYTPGRMPEFQG